MISFIQNLQIAQFRFKIYFWAKEAQRSMLIRNERWQKTQLSRTPPMDSDGLRCLLGKCSHFKYFLWSFCSGQFAKANKRRFFIVNASPAQHERSHWMVILFHENKVCFSWHAWSPDTKLPNIVFPSDSFLQWSNSVTQDSASSKSKLKTLWSFLHLISAYDGWLRISFIVEYER